MSESIIGMYDMGLIFEVTDAMGIDRESISVPLGKEDPGAVQKLATGEIEIIVPESIALDQWIPHMQAELEKLGYELEN